MVNGKQLEAESTLKRIAKFNGNPLPAILLKSPTISNEKKYTYFHLFRSRKVAVFTFDICILYGQQKD